MNKNESIEKAKNAVKKATPQKQQPKEKKNVFKKIVRFFRETKSEAKKVVWPNAKQIKNNLFVVIVVMALASVIIWPVDFLAISLFNFLF